MTKWCAHLKYPQKGTEVYCFYLDGKELEYLCPDCARKAGLCPGCGRFVAMSDWDDFSLQKYGLCEECQGEFERETSKYLDDDTLGYYIGGDEQ